MQRWKEVLQEFDCEVRHWAGNKNRGADILSRINTQWPPLKPEEVHRYLQTISSAATSIQTPHPPTLALAPTPPLTPPPTTLPAPTKMSAFLSSSSPSKMTWAAVAANGAPLPPLPPPPPGQQSLEEPSLLLLLLPPISGIYGAEDEAPTTNGCQGQKVQEKVVSPGQNGHRVEKKTVGRPPHKKFEECLVHASDKEVAGPRVRPANPEALPDLRSTFRQNLWKDNVLSEIQDMENSMYLKLAQGARKNQDPQLNLEHGFRTEGAEASTFDQEDVEMKNILEDKG
ncbi:hypothetical protein BDZ91DRAFT_803865 [Kalaharituber pfeilii]|nr:hypothetical protein BDZ91DRAFT_803865 [Kalaharituber pfeilii]